MTCHRLRHPGFSLAELVVVLIILAFLAAIAAPRVSNTLRRQRLDAASRRLIVDLELVRSQAILDGANRALTLSVAGQYYTLPSQVSVGAGSRVDLNAAPYEGVSLVGTSFNPAEVVYNRLGLPQSVGAITLQAGPEQAIITLSAASGRATRTFGP
jgi:prepilin-type N-terminal cleavage/methylation domain-containing protein